jgi:hypothetical protein
MTKRNDGAFARNAADFYATPPRAVLPLLPYLDGIKTFAEPCAGDGSLMRHLMAHGLQCVYAGDSAQGQNALELTPEKIDGADAIITNPPYERPLMHALIAHFLTLAPTWLLLELDWFATAQSAPYATFCTDVVHIGRVKWIPDSRTQGFDNYVWARFDASGAPQGARMHIRKVNHVEP